MIFKTVSGSGTIVSLSAQLHKQSISKATAEASAQVSTVFTGLFWELNCRTLYISNRLHNMTSQTRSGGTTLATLWRRNSAECDNSEVTRHAELQTFIRTGYRNGYFRCYNNTKGPQVTNGRYAARKYKVRKPGRDGNIVHGRGKGPF